MDVSRAGWMQKTGVQEVKHFHKLTGPQTQAPSQGGTRGWSEGRAEHPRWCPGLPRSRGGSPQMWGRCGLSVRSRGPVLGVSRAWGSL